MRNALSIDFECWRDTEVIRRALSDARRERLPARLEQGLDRLLELLDGFGVNATFFVTGAVARAVPGVVARIASLGHELGCHHDSHVRVHEHGAARFRDEVSDAVSAISDVTGVAVRGYRAPTWSLQRDNISLLHVLDELGFHYDSSIQPGALGPWGIDGVPLHPFRVRGTGLLEIPPTAITLPLLGARLPAAGGFFLRAIPTRALCGYLWWLNRQRVPGVVWVHSWEMDRDLPRLALPAIGRLVQYHNLGSVEGRLRFLLRRVDGFGPLAGLLDRGWPVVDLGLADA